MLTENIGSIVEDYIKLRNDIAASKKAYEDLKKANKAVMAEMEMHILEEGKRQGVESFSTAMGTAYRTRKTFARNADMDARIAYAKETNDYGCFTSHVGKLHVLELINDGINPAEIGVEYFEEDVVQIRKS